MPLSLKEDSTSLFDYFIRNSFDLLSVIKVSGIGGERYKWANSADLSASWFRYNIVRKTYCNKRFHVVKFFHYGIFQKMKSRIQCNNHKSTRW